MKKALTITIAGTLFTIEEDAYKKLDDYLSSIKQYFGTYSDSIEIVKDIEARIAEQLIEYKTSNGIVTIESVNKVISIMGRVEDFGERQEENTTASSASASYQGTYRKLYRNTDDVVIAGVASGIASYLNVDPLYIRLAFIIVGIFSSGGGILIYALLALILPKAETAAEKIQMKGGPVTLNSFKETVNEYTETIKKNGSEYMSKESKPRRIIESIIKVFGKIAVMFIKIITKMAAFALVIGSIIVIFSVSFAFINLTFNVHSPYVEFPLAQVVSSPIYYSLIILGYIIVLAPLITLLTLGSSFLRRKNIINPKGFLALGIIWFIAVIVFGSLSLRYIPEINARIMALPQYQKVTVSEPLENFTKLELHGVDKVHLIQSPTFSVSSSGRKIDVDRTHMEVKNDTLILTQQSLDKMCFFCLGRQPVEIIIGMPEVDEISTTGLVSLNTDPLTLSSLNIKLSGASSAVIPLTASTTVIQESGNASLSIEGKTTNLTLTTSGTSHFDGVGFVLEDAKVHSSGASHVEINASKSLEAQASGVSSIIYHGAPKVTQDTSGNAHVLNTSEANRIQQDQNIYTDDSMYSPEDQSGWE